MKGYKAFKVKETPARIAFNTFNVVFMIVLMSVMLYPMWYVVCASFSNPRSLMGYDGLLIWPLDASLASYKMMLKNTALISSAKNTLFILVVGTVVNIIMTSIGAFVLSRKNVHWNKLFSKLVILTMFIGGGLVPTYLVVTKMLFLKDSLWALILPEAISVYNLLIMRTSFSAIPDTLEEAAKIDGAGSWTILFKVILPLSKAIIAVMILYYGVSHWNAWFNASIYLISRDKYPLQLILREILISGEMGTMSEGVGAADQEMAGETIKYAVIVFTTAPILCVYPFLQKYFVKGVMIGAVKG